MKCFSPLGMESGRIPDRSIVASSRFTEFSGPERGRLNLKQNGKEQSVDVTSSVKCMMLSR